MVLAVRLLFIFVGGTFLGSLVNWAIYSLAWNRRAISPWSRCPEAAPRRWPDRVPIFGWFTLRREAHVHGPRFWLRPMLLEVATGVALAALYWWEVDRVGLIQDQLRGVAIVTPAWAVHWQFVSHGILLCLLIAASFIDIDEKIIPDEITVPGTLLGLLLATVVPLSLLPDVVPRTIPPAIGSAPFIPLVQIQGGLIAGQFGGSMCLEPMTAVAPQEWPPSWGAPRQWQSLVAGVGCYWLWCFALAPRIWRGRRGPLFALRLIGARLRREFGRPPLRLVFVAGTVAIVCVWRFGDASWAGLLTALVGLAGSGGLVWAVRVVGTAALRREAMGFGDVTLMMMMGTFLGWQACLIAFFVAPFAALLIGIAQFVLRRDDVIPLGPFLSLGAAVVVVDWAPIWVWGQQLFAAGWLVPAVLVVCLVMLGFMLAVWAAIKRFLFGDPEAE
ncbi:MAG TPA: A24 family peptidase [Lacipirellulaceae bacterium]|nr:A24 family peptidase [Lacipirellulaceae bacterium]